jgi:hypothetical protein
VLFGGSIRLSTAAFRSGEYPTSSSYPAHLKNRAADNFPDKGGNRNTPFSQPNRFDMICAANGV